MMKSTAIALVVALATFTAPAAMARPHGAHSHHTGSHASGPGYAGAYPVGPSYAPAYPAGPNWGSECVTDDGQGRYFPCDGPP